MLRELLERGDSSHVALAIAGEPYSLTYGNLRRQVDALVSELRAMGLGRGDRIAIAIPNGLEMVASFLAVVTMGIAAPLNPAYKEEEFRFYLKDTDARALIVPSSGGEEARHAANPDTVIIEASIDLDSRVRFSAGHAAPNKKSGDDDAGDIAMILHTSGTTSRPKRVPLSHANLATSASNIAQTYQLNTKDVSLCVMPLFHVHGLVASLLATLYAGGTVVVIPRFNPLSFWSVVSDYRVTWYSAVPTIHQLLLSRRRGDRKVLPKAESLRFIRSCSAPLSPQMMMELEESFGAPVLEAYGMTEAAHQIASNPVPPGARKAGSVGRGTAVEISILDEAGQLLPAGSKGEVAIRGANIFEGYEGNSEANASSFTNGWFRTGDEGVLDEEGYLTLVGRIKELINRGGEKISPREIDEALLAHGAVSEAVCFGVSDRIYGEEVAAAVVVNGPVTKDDLLAHCRALLADFKCPKRIYIVEAIPRTATGKVQRRNVAAAIAGGGQSQ
jgi:oxalate---CoA ligase